VSASAPESAGGGSPPGATESEVWESTRSDSSPAASGRQPAGLPDPAAGSEPTRLQPAKTPVGTPTVGLLGLLFALITIAMGVVMVRDGLVYAGWVSGLPWIQGVADRLGPTHNDSGVLAWGIVVAIVGLVLLLFAFGRRPRPPYQLAGTVPMFLTARDVGRVVSTAAESVDGVLGAKAKAGRRRVRVALTTTAHGPNDGIDSVVAQEIGRRLDALAKPPRVTIDVEGGQ